MIHKGFGRTDFLYFSASVVLFLCQGQALRRFLFMLKKQNKIRTESQILAIPQSDILPNPNQPRKRFDYDELEGLAQSIRANGILQPLIVRELENGNMNLLQEKEDFVRQGLQDSQKSHALSVIFLKQIQLFLQCLKTFKDKTLTILKKQRL